MRECRVRIYRSQQSSCNVPVQVSPGFRKGAPLHPRGDWVLGLAWAELGAPVMQGLRGRRNPPFFER